MSKIISADKALKKISQFNCQLIDVRSEKEYELGHIPNAVNIPILNNDHRHQVGLKYKQEGQLAAIELGYKLVLPLRDQILNRWKASAGENTLVYCWRGGLRSKISCEWMEACGLSPIRIEGGYKALRRKLLSCLNLPPSLVVLGGLTGTGKTLILKEIPWSINLEDLAQHRGSAFGALIHHPQPTQQNFENALGLAFFKTAATALVEDESRSIGRLVLPACIYDQMACSPTVIIEEPINWRAQYIYETYVLSLKEQKLSNETIQKFFVSNLNRISRKLGGLEHSRILKLMTDAFELGIEDPMAHIHWIKELLLKYYDPMYRYAMTKKERKILYQGPKTTVKEFLLSYNPQKTL